MSLKNNNIYYGINKPKNKPNSQPASFEQAYKAKQLRLWGLKQINENDLKKIYKEYTTLKQKAKNKANLIKKIFILEGNITKLKKTLNDKNVRNDKKKIEDINNKIDEFKKKRSILAKEYELL